MLILQWLFHILVLIFFLLILVVILVQRYPSLFSLKTWWCGNTKVNTLKLNTWLCSSNYAFFSLTMSSSTFTVLWIFEEEFALLVTINNFPIARLMWSWSLSMNGEPVHSPGKRVIAQKFFHIKVIDELIKVKILHHIDFIKV